MTTRNVASEHQPAVVTRPVEVPPPTAKPAETLPVSARPPRFTIRDADLFFAGIGGCGMSGLARMFTARGARISGSDSAESPVTNALRADGFSVLPEPAVKSLPDPCDALIASAAIRPDHPLMLDAETRGIPVFSYAEALGELMARSTGVAVAGTHGKSTTTAMLGAALVDAALDPNVIVGATCPQLAGGSLGSPVFAGPTGFRTGSHAVPAGPYAGREGLLLAEACEYNRSFHNLAPVVASISSVEADHLDVYGSLDQVVEAFRGFAARLPSEKQGGYLLIAHEGAHRREITAGLSCAVETIGFSPEADWHVSFDPAEQRVTLSHHHDLVARWGMRMPGAHNAMNAATACALGVVLGGNPETLARSLGAFRGLERRCQFLAERQITGGGVRVYDDYGHHPSEIDATLRALRELERPEQRNARLVCVFQPHQHSRTRFLLDEFAAAFSQADVVIVPHIYFVRDSEAEKQRVTAADLVDRLRSRGVRAMHLYPFGAIVEQLENVCRPGDLLVVMGAGPVWQVARGYLEAGT